MLCSEKQVAKATCARDDEDKTDVIDEDAESSHRSKAQCIPQNQVECLFGRGAKVCAHQCSLDVCILVEKLYTLLEAPNAALQTFKGNLHEFVLLRLGLLRHVLHQIPDKLYDGHDQRSEGHGSYVISADSLSSGAENARPSSWGEEPQANAHGNQNLPQGDVEGIVPKENKEGGGEAEVENIPWWSTSPALGDAIFIITDGVFPN